MNENMDPGHYPVQSVSSLNEVSMCAVHAVKPKVSLQGLNPCTKLLRDPLAEAVPLAGLIFDTDSALFRITEGLSAMPVVLTRSVHMRIILPSIFPCSRDWLRPFQQALLCPAPRAKAFTGGTVLCTCRSGTAGTLKDRGASQWLPS